MSERLIIENFLGLKNIDLEVRDINILIGPQATGKSVIAKLLYYFKGIIPEFFHILNVGKNKRGLNKVFIESFYKYFPRQFWSSTVFKIRYEIGGAFIEINYNNEKKNSLEISYSDIFSDLRNAFKKEIKNMQHNTKDRDIIRIKINLHKNIKIIIERFLYEINLKLGSSAGFYQIFIPAGRLFYSYLHKNIFTLLSNNMTIDTFLIEFGNLYEQIKYSYLILREEKETPKRIDKLINQLLSGTYIQVREEDYIKLNDGRIISVVNASSGQQEILPLTIFLDSFITDNNIYDSQTIYIEEPEAHLFPTSQKHIVELIASTFNLSKTPLQFFITTHSPYILTSLNNLIQAGILQKKFIENPEKLEALYKVIPKEQMIDPEKVAAHTLENGKLINLLDKEYQIMNADSIDDVSSEIGVVFDKLVDMEYK